MLGPCVGGGFVVVSRSLRPRWLTVLSDSGASHSATLAHRTLRRWRIVLCDAGALCFATWHTEPCDAPVAILTQATFGPQRGLPTAIGRSEARAVQRRATVRARHDVRRCTLLAVGQLSEARRAAGDDRALRGR